MNNNVLTALIAEGSSAVVAITALFLNHRGFASIDGRFNSIERRLDLMHSEMKDLNRSMRVLEVDLALLNDEAGR